MSKVVFEYNNPDDDEEQLEIVLNGEVIMTANHDDDGWQGMERLLALCRAIEAKLNQ